MAIQRGDPLRSLSETLAPDTKSWRPALDLFEDSGRYVVRADLPGVPREEVAIEVEDERLVIRGVRRTDRGSGGAAYLRLERPAGPFAAEISLPASVDRNRIQASHRNGVLEIVLPKKQNQAPCSIRVDGD